MHENADTLSTETRAFARDIASLLQSHPGRFAVYFGAQLLGVFDDRDDAFAAGYDAIRAEAPFLVRVIETASAPEPSTWELGRSSD